MSKTSLAKKALMLTSARCLAFVLTAFHPVVLTRILGKGDYGTYAQFYLIVMTLIPLGEMGIAQGIYYFLPKGEVIKRAIAYQACLLVSVTGGVVVCCLLTYDSLIAALMGNPQITVLVPFMAFYCYCGIASSAFEALMIADGNSAHASAVTLAMQVLNSFALIGGALAGRSLSAIMTALCVASGLRLLFQYLYVMRRFGFPPQAADFAGIGTTLRYVVPTGTASFIWSLQGKVQGYLVSALFLPAVYATYAVGTVSLPFVGIITATAGNIMMTEVSSSDRDDEGKKRVLSLWNSAIRKMNLALMPMFVFFFVMSEPFIVFMYTEQYRDCVSLFKLSLLNVLIASINNAAIIGGLGESRYLMKLSILRLPLSLLVMTLFIKLFGITGAVLGNVMVTIFIILIEFRKVASLLDVSWIELVRWGDNVRIFAAAVAASLPVLAIATAGWPPLVTLAAGVVVYGATYLGLAWITVLRADEIELLRRFAVTFASWWRAAAPTEKRQSV